VMVASESAPGQPLCWLEKERKLVVSGLIR
jgi:hypothetical protein